MSLRPRKSDERIRKACGNSVLFPLPRSTTTRPPAGSGPIAVTCAPANAGADCIPADVDADGLSSDEGAAPVSAGADGGCVPATAVGGKVPANTGASWDPADASVTQETRTAVNPDSACAFKMWISIVPRLATNGVKLVAVTAVTIAEGNTASKSELELAVSEGRSFVIQGERERERDTDDREIQNERER